MINQLGLGENKAIPVEGSESTNPHCSGKHHRICFHAKPGGNAEEMLCAIEQEGTENTRLRRTFSEQWQKGEGESSFTWGWFSFVRSGGHLDVCLAIGNPPSEDWLRCVELIDVPEMPRFSIKGDTIMVGKGSDLGDFWVDAANQIAGSVMTDLRQTLNFSKSPARAARGRQGGQWASGNSSPCGSSGYHTITGG